MQRARANFIKFESGPKNFSLSVSSFRLSGWCRLTAGPPTNRLRSRRRTTGSPKQRFTVFFVKSPSSSMPTTFWFSPFTNQNVTGILLPIFSGALLFWKSPETLACEFSIDHHHPSRSLPLLMVPSRALLGKDLFMSPSSCLGSTETWAVTRPRSFCNTQYAGLVGEPLMLQATSACLPCQI
jgi:hypothetical protein